MLPRGLTSLLDSGKNKASSAAGPAAAAAPAAAASAGGAAGGAPMASKQLHNEVVPRREWSPTSNNALCPRVSNVRNLYPNHQRIRENPQQA